LNGKLPVKWTRETVAMGEQSFPATYAALNTGLTIEDRGYNGGCGTPLWGACAVVKAQEGWEVPDLLSAGLLGENWKPENNLSAAEAREARRPAKSIQLERNRDIGDDFNQCAV
jgi:hypothetical protein